MLGSFFNGASIRVLCLIICSFKNAKTTGGTAQKSRRKIKKKRKKEREKERKKGGKTAKIRHTM